MKQVKTYKYFQFEKIPRIQKLMAKKAMAMPAITYVVAPSVAVQV